MFGQTYDLCEVGNPRILAGIYKHATSARSKMSRWPPLIYIIRDWLNP